LKISPFMARLRYTSNCLKMALRSA
jgi:hypothetical protein